MTADHMLVWLADVAVKGLLLLALAVAIVGSMRYASAAARHMVWTLAVVGALLLPALSAVLPQWQVSILPASLFPTRPLSNLVEGGTREQKDATIRYFGALLGLRGSAWEGTKRIDEALSASLPASWFSRHDGPMLILVAWIGGMGLVMVPWMAGAWTVWRLGRRAQPVTDAFISNMFRGLLWEYSIRRRVELLVGTQSMTPLAWGVFRPCVLLPPEALRWPADRLRSVLLHELAHVKRWDCATQLLGQIVCAVYWFNPMAWLMARWMRAEHERACDDMVLAWGLGEAVYAEHLVQIARSLRAPAMPWMAAVAMARTSQLRDRLVAILDTSRERGKFGSRTLTAALVLTLVIVAPLAMLHGADPVLMPPVPAITAAAESSVLNTTAVLVSEGNYYLERVFQSMPPMKVRMVKPAEFEEAGAGDAGLVIFDRYTPVHTPAVPSIFFAAVSSEGPTRAKNEVLTDIRMEVANPGHPIVKGLNLSRIYASRSLRLDVAEQTPILVNGNGEPMIVVDGENRRIIVAFDVMQSNWPLRTSFPIFMYRAVEDLLKRPTQVAAAR